jgi:nucleotide-binding universal stress UspA family protein
MKGPFVIAPEVPRLSNGEAGAAHHRDMTGIVVGVDGSTSSAHALTWGAREADLRGWPLRAVLAWDFMDQYHLSADGRFDPQYTEKDAVEALDAYIANAFAPEPPPRMERMTVCDLPARALIETSSDASLLVVGARGRGGFRELLLGSVSQHCVHHATCPVAIVRPRTDVSVHDAERVVVGIDGSDTAKRALRWAVEEAATRKGQLEVVHAWHLPYVDGYPYSVPLSSPGAFEEAAHAVVADALAGIDTTVLSEPVVTTVRCVGPAQALLDAAATASLVVVGSRGRGGFAGLLLGSVSHHVSHHATCPVVIVPPEQ